MQSVARIMPPRAGGRHPVTPDAPAVEPGRPDLFAPEPVGSGARPDTVGGPRRKAQRGMSPGSAGDKGSKPETDTDLDGAELPDHLGVAKQSVPKYGPPSAILVGEAGANLVLSRLQSWGIPTQIAMPGIAYDLIADIPGLDLLRIQVKTCSRPKGQVCSFTMTRGFYHSKAGMYKYSRDDFDLAAFVCLSIGAVFFCHEPRNSISVPRAWMQSSTIAQDSFDLALGAIQRRRQIDQLSWLASMKDCPPVPGVGEHPPQTPGPDRMPVPMSVPVRTPAPTMVPVQSASSPITRSPVPFDAMDRDERLAMFRDDEGDVVIPI